jgi:hypothetical protein
MHSTSRPSERADEAGLAAELVTEVNHGLARHAVEDVSPDDALLLAIDVSSKQPTPRTPVRRSPRSS